MRIGIIVAMRSEREQLAALLGQPRAEQRGGREYLRGRLGAHETILAECGIGKVNAAIGAAELMRGYAPQCIVSTGVAGGTGAGVQVMDVVAATRTAYHDVWCGEGNALGQVQGLPLYYEAHPALAACAAKLAGEWPVRTGLICTGDRFVTAPEELRAIRAAFPDVQAVDMESAAIAQACHLAGMPFISFRVISDTPGVEGHFSQYLGFWDRMAERSFAVTRAFLASLPERL